MSEVDLALWDYADSAGASSPIEREIRKSKMSTDAAGQLEQAMSRVAAGKPLPKETDPVRSGIYELRLDKDDRWYRLLWGKHKGRFIALLFVVKKRNKLDDAWIKQAIKRLKEHKRLNP